MRGDKLLVEEHHRRAAEQALALLEPEITGGEGRFIITIAGESGSGKSEVAAALSDALAARGIRSHIFQQDDYFVYPPKTNLAMRRRDINHVGTTEVRLDLLDENLAAIRAGRTEIAKPLVDFDADAILEETASVAEAKVILVEGTYTTTLANAHRRIFIDRTNVDTRDARRLRAREEQDGFLEEVLEIEHGIIAPQKARADFIITKEYQVSADEPQQK
jgi:uridine kinase